MSIGNLHSQEYRNAEAYIKDFEKNETYVKNALIEYSSSIIYDQLDARIEITLNRIYHKLEAINTNLTINDKGFKGDLSLNNAFIKMNNSTISHLKNKSLPIDYNKQKSLDFPDIFKCFKIRQQEINNYYLLIVEYNNSKRNFCMRNKIAKIRYFSKKKIFEHEAHQSFIFFKLNLLDAKLCDLLLTTDIENVRKCFTFLNQICDESIVETEKYKNVLIDQSLNNENIALIQFLIQQNKSLIPLYNNYIQVLNELNILKENLDDNNNEVFLKNYNEKILLVNSTKNLFFDNLSVIQSQKKVLLDKWYLLKNNFLKDKL